ncbi:hypothetical protein JTB14_025994 [Gonioctena quinquepunctata]|nr:hypothetical protein JTB14_025994 [Gonioctena quinquepunctata]
MFSLPKLIHGDTYPEDSWLVQANIDELDEIKFLKLYAEALLLSFCFFFGVSHNKYIIRITSEEIILTVITIIGRLYTLYMIADLLKIFGLVGVSEKHLRSELFLFNARKLLESEKILRNVPRSSLGALFAFMKSETFLPTDVITRAGSKIENGVLHTIGYGCCYQYRRHRNNSFRRRGEFGLWVAANGNIMYTYFAVEITELLYLPKKVFLDFLEEHPDVSKYIEVMVKKKMGKSAGFESSLHRGGEDVISALRSRKLLEKQAVRTRNLEIDF